MHLPRFRKREFLIFRVGRLTFGEKQVRQMPPVTPASHLRKSRREAQQRHGRQSDDGHGEFHQETWNDERPIALDRIESHADDILDGDVGEFRS